MKSAYTDYCRDKSSQSSTSLGETHPAVAVMSGESGRQPEGGGRWELHKAGEAKKQKEKDDGR